MSCFDAETPTPAVKKGKKKDPTPQMLQLVNKEGEVIFTSDIPALEGMRSEVNKHFAENFHALLRQALDADIDPAQIHLEGRILNDVNLSHMDLTGITMMSCSFNRADLRHTTLRNANLEDCTFANTRMNGADLTNANVDDVSFDEVEARYIAGLIMFGDLDSWVVTGYRRSNGQLWIKAGCRNFPYAEALEHWKDREDRKEILAALPLMEAIARNRGWRIGDEPGGEVVAGDGPVAEPVDEEDDE